MAEFTRPADLLFNRGAIADPAAYAQETGCASWLSLTGPEFAAMDGGISFDSIRAAVPEAVNIISDPPRELTLELARAQVAALDALPRPTLVSCRTGPRSSAVVYMYAGLRSGATPEAVVAAVERDDAPCAAVAEYKTWIAESMAALRAEA